MGEPAFERQTRASAARLRSAVIYAADGRASQANITVTGTEATERYVHAVIDRSPSLTDAARVALRAAREQLMKAGRPVEQYRQLTVEAALARLAG